MSLMLSKQTSNKIHNSLDEIGLKIFYLNRKEDVTGISGTGVVAMVIQLPSGKCIMEWYGKFKTDTLFDDISEILEIHSHGGRTELVEYFPIHKLRKSV